MIDQLSFDWLARLEDRAHQLASKTTARRGLDPTPLSDDEDARFDELWDKRGDGLTEAEEAELYTLLGKYRITDNETDEDHEYDDEIDGVEDADSDSYEEEEDESDDTNDEDDDADIEAVDWDPVELAFIIAFHRFAKRHESIWLPELWNLLNEFLIFSGCRLFAQYGWIVGQPDCSTILPLDEWASTDCEWITTLYKPSAGILLQQQIDFERIAQAEEAGGISRGEAEDAGT